MPERTSPLFKRIHLEISNICNLQCSFCPEVKKDKQWMRPEEFETILKQAVPLTEIISLHLMGEPLTHPKLSEILEICDRYQAQIDITTNGLLIQKQQNLLIQSKSVRQVKFSLQAFRDNAPDKDINAYLKPIFEFIKLSHKQKPTLYVNLRLWNQKSVAEDNNEWFDKIEEEFEVHINRTIDVGGIKSKKIWNKLYLHFDSRFQWPSLDFPYQGTQGRCNGVLNHIGIHADGTVVPCCLDKDAIINLGNVKIINLENIVKSNRFLAMKQGFLNGQLVEELCQHCEYINRYKK